MSYNGPITDMKTRAMPSPLPPTEAELAEWNALSREEQVNRYREALSHPDCDIVTETTMAEILAEDEGGWELPIAPPQSDTYRWISALISV